MPFEQAGQAQLSAIDPPASEWLEPPGPDLGPIPAPVDATGGQKVRPGYHRPTNGHPHRSQADPGRSAHSGPRPEVPENERLFMAGQPDHPPQPLCISPPRLDGHTRARIVADPRGFAPGFSALIAKLRAPRTAEQSREERRTGLMLHKLPTPSWDQHWTAFDVTVKGTRRQLIDFYCQDRVHISVNAETGAVLVQWKAKELWAYPWAITGARWISDLSRLLFDGLACELSESFAAGWRMCGIELCADVVDFPVTTQLANRFAGGLKPGGEGLWQEHEAESIMLGRRETSNVSLIIYDKTGQIREKKAGDDSTYRAAWLAGGWDGAASVTRIELRLQRFGLTFRLADNGACRAASSRILYDFRDPAMLASFKNLGVAWRHCLQRHRMVLCERTRKRRDAMDPRWVPVVECGGAEPPALKQFRAVQADAWDRKMENALRTFVRAAGQVAALSGIVVDQTRPGEILRFAEQLAARMGDDLGEYGEAYFESICPFVGPEISQKGQKWAREFAAAEGAAFVFRDFYFWNSADCDRPFDRYENASLERAMATGPPGPEKGKQEWQEQTSGNPRYTKA